MKIFLCKRIWFFLSDDFFLNTCNLLLFIIIFRCHTHSLSTRWFWCFSRFHSVVLLNFEREHKIFCLIFLGFFSFCRVCIAFEGFFWCMPFNLSFSFRNKYFLFLFFDCKGISKFSIITLFSKTKWEANERWSVISFAKTQRKTNRDK